MKKIRERIDKMLQGRYGIDDLGRMLMITALGLYVIGVVLKNQWFFSLSTFIIIIVIYRMMSRQHWERGEENRRYTGCLKLWKLRYENRKYSRIFVCKKCGRFIRVPKGKGKIQVTCTSCGDKTIRRT